MKHLTFDEILNFVSLDTINSETVELASRVNTHIRQCGECLERVKAFQAIYDEFNSMGIEKDTRDFIALINRVPEEKQDCFEQN